LFPLRIVVIGSGVSGLSAAWLLSRAHDVTLYERAIKPGGHRNTVDVDLPDGRVAVDTGFIVYNPPAYPNLTALFRHLGVDTEASRMTFSVSLEGGGYEYSGSGPLDLFGQPGNLLSPKHWRMVADIGRFFRSAQSEVRDGESLGAFLARQRYSRAFVERHLLAMAGAIWSCAPDAMRDYPAPSLIAFFANHGLLRARRRPQWRTVAGGSRNYLRQLIRDGDFRFFGGIEWLSVMRRPNGVGVRMPGGAVRHYDHVVIATHADQALGLLEDADAREREALGVFRFTRNRAVLHRDRRLMPKRRRLWSSWNCNGANGCVTYWMNSLQNLETRHDLFVTLNPPFEPSDAIATFDYDHPRFDLATLRAQNDLWSLQGRRRTWFCGAWFGSGFHEDELQAGLAVAEQLSGVRRPWSVANKSARIHLVPPTDAILLQAAE
jgi:predicted NAD/FAD-binding protein